MAYPVAKTPSPALATDETKASISSRVVSVMLDFFAKNSVDELHPAAQDLVHELEALTEYLVSANASLERVTAGATTARLRIEKCVDMERAARECLEDLFTEALRHLAAERAQYAALQRGSVGGGGVCHSPTEQVSHPCEDQVDAPTKTTTTTTTTTSSPTQRKAASFASALGAATAAIASTTNATAKPFQKKTKTMGGVVEEMVSSLLFFFGEKKSVEELHYDERALVEKLSDITAHLVKTCENSERVARQSLARLERTQAHLAKHRAVRDELESMVTQTLDCLAMERAARASLEADIYIRTAVEDTHVDSQDECGDDVPHAKAPKEEPVPMDDDASDTDTSSGEESSGDGDVIDWSREAPIEDANDLEGVDQVLETSTLKLAAMKSDLLTMTYTDEAVRCARVIEFVPRVEALVDDLAVDGVSEEHTRLIDECEAMLSDMYEYLEWVPSQFDCSSSDDDDDVDDPDTLVATAATAPATGA